MSLLHFRNHRPARTLALAAALSLALAACGSAEPDPAAPGGTETVTDTVTGEPTGTGTATETDTDTGTEQPTEEPTEETGEETGGGEADGQEPEAESPDEAAGEGEIAGMPVYYLGESPDGPRLFREFRTVPDVGDPVASAVSAMMSLPPHDADYVTPWVDAGEVSVQRDGDVLTVDVPAEAFGGSVGSQHSEVAIQQLVYTATAAASVAGEPASQVVVLIDGEPGDAWGHVMVGELMERAPQTDVLNWTWITSPAQGGTMDAGEVTISGYGASFEGNFVITVTGETDSGTSVEVSEPTTSTNGMGFGTWEFTVDLEPGEYTVRAENSSGRDDFEPDTDTKAFTVE
ncbi:MAG: Gmad2 immunoglobulin-like domain-containing protein [Actinomycetia bacterium]|nr:Gmad2 immunoglobulin-like domain-containing protein [Actinomycetes bacterium]